MKLVMALKTGLQARQGHLRFMLSWGPVRLWAISALILALLLGASSFLLYQREYTRALVLAEETAFGLEVLTRNIFSGLERTLEDISTLALQAESAEDAAVIHALLQHQQRSHPVLLDLMFFSPNGYPRYATGQASQHAVRYRDYFNHHWEQSDSLVYVARPQLNLQPQVQWFFSFSRAARDADGRLLGIAVALLDVAALEEYYAALRDSPHLAMALFRSDGVGLLQVPASRFAGSNVLVDPQDMLANLTIPVTAQGSGADYQRRVMSARPLQDYGLVIVGAANLKPALALWQWTALAAFLIWLVFAYAGFWLASRLYETQQRLRHLAYFDPVTGLPNRSLLFEMLGHALKITRRSKGRLALLFIDLNDFKIVNDRYSHAVGDRLLHEVAQRLRKTLREADLVGRIGGDEFVVVLHGIVRPKDALDVAEMLHANLTQPYVLTHENVRIGCSIGIALFPDHGQTDHELAHYADLAMYQAKIPGQPDVRLFEPGMTLN